MSRFDFPRAVAPLTPGGVLRLAAQLLCLGMLLFSLLGCSAREEPVMSAPPPASEGQEEMAAAMPDDSSEEVALAAGADVEPLPADSPTPVVSLPNFPWPPPRYSAFSAIANEWVAQGAAPVLGEVARRLEQAFDSAGYGERTYYRIPGGFALVSRIEHIRADASPMPDLERWVVDTPRVRAGFIDHVRALFNAPPGFYRVIVFVVTDQDFVAAEQAPTATEAREWLTGGGLRLPAGIALQPYGARHYTTALIYEFERRSNQPQASVRDPSPAPGRTHLDRAGLWQALAAR